MKLRALAAVVALMWSGAALSGPDKPNDLGTLTDVARVLTHSFANYTGAFTDYYTFTLEGASGERSVAALGQVLGGDGLDGLSVSITGTSLDGSLVDATPQNGFTFYRLSRGGSYTLAVSGYVHGEGGYAGYVAAVPEPEQGALALMGLVGVAIMVARHKKTAAT